MLNDNKDDGEMAAHAMHECNSMKLQMEKMQAQMMRMQKEMLNIKVENEGNMNLNYNKVLSNDSESMDLVSDISINSMRILPEIKNILPSIVGNSVAVPFGDEAEISDSEELFRIRSIEKAAQTTTGYNSHGNNVLIIKMDDRRAL